MAVAARMTDPGICPTPWNPHSQRGRLPSCSASQSEVTMWVPSTIVLPPLEGKMAPVVKPSICSLVSPASAMASSAVLMARVPRGSSMWRVIGLWA
jgi:hypothetical protein